MRFTLLLPLLCPLSLLPAPARVLWAEIPVPYTITFSQFKPADFVDLIGDYFQGGCAADRVCWAGYPLNGVALSSDGWTANTYSHSALGSWKTGMLHAPRIVSAWGFSGSVTVVYEHNIGLSPLTMRVMQGETEIKSVQLLQPPATESAESFIEVTLKFNGTADSLEFTNPAEPDLRYYFASIHFAHLREEPVTPSKYHW